MISDLNLNGALNVGVCLFSWSELNSLHCLLSKQDQLDLGFNLFVVLQNYSVVRKEVPSIEYVKVVNLF